MPAAIERQQRNLDLGDGLAFFELDDVVMAGSVSNGNQEQWEYIATAASEKSPAVDRILLDDTHNAEFTAGRGHDLQQTPIQTHVSDKSVHDIEGKFKYPSADSFPNTLEKKPLHTKIVEQDHQGKGGGHVTVNMHLSVEGKVAH